jgi:hypothetical protein
MRHAAQCIGRPLHSFIHRVADLDPHYFGSWIRIRIRVRAKSWIRIHIKVLIQELYRLEVESSWRAVDAHNGGMEAENEPWRVCRSVVADSCHLNEEQDTDSH